jgi:3-oxoacyl-(acyl-carrier-protein) synthase III
VQTHNVGILATGSYLPKEEVGNEEIARQAGVTPEWIERKTKIRSRRFAAPDEATSDLAAKAAQQALEQAGIPAENLDYVVVSTSTGDHPQPPTAHLVQSALGARNAACFDINVVCSGFVYGLALARGLLALNPDAVVLVVAADVYSRILDFTDRRTAPLFADGAGAAVVTRVPEPYGIIGVSLTGQGDASRLIRVDAGGSRTPASHETVDAGAHYFRMDGRGVRDFVMERVPAALRQLVIDNGIGLEQVEHFIPHQPNGVLLEEMTERTGLVNARLHRTLDKYGNVGSASVAVTLDEASRSGQLCDGDLVLLAGFGGGMAMGSMLLRWGAAR